ncbi:cysteinyl-tRNA synthetase [Candidatus Woesebacteria bacterium]|nr:cysteinyl-tRNA synthetase [Candidatus Woesebacteria bacterium]
MSANVPVKQISDLPRTVQELLVERASVRKNKDFTQSDQLREEIKQLGYLVNDSSDGTEILKIGDESLAPAKNFLLLFGSGEIAPSSVDIYRQTFLSLGKRHLKIALITTPAGFQPNVEHVYGEIRDFLIASLPDFNLTVELIFANTAGDAMKSEIVEQLSGSDVIFMGPGSPTYAVKNLNGTPLLAKIIELIKRGSTLVLASAATIACSRFALPVYEIFKVGEKLHWENGLNLYKEIWQEATVLPHFNNKEGGADLDTSYCFVGQGRAERLLSMLPSKTKVMGIDEHTALIIDLTNQKESVRGKGITHSVK